MGISKQKERDCIKSILLCLTIIFNIFLPFSRSSKLLLCWFGFFFSLYGVLNPARKLLWKNTQGKCDGEFLFTDFSSNIVSFLPPLSTLQTQSSAHWCQRKNPHWPHAALDHASSPEPFVFISELTGALKNPVSGALEVPSTALMAGVSFQCNCVVWIQDNILPSIYHHYEFIWHSMYSNNNEFAGYWMSHTFTSTAVHCNAQQH